MKKCYLAGPVTGTEDYQQRFDDAAKEVVAMGMVPVNPVTLLHDHDKTWESYMKETIQAMMDCKAIYLMKGWNKSRGATIEMYLAEDLAYEIIFQTN